ncbi:uncharacterized protein LOC114580691 isoform X2 [Dendrobium catenatum]|uniref:uncharacterized protein LOC114580691 isoform X2 n=1 Tax=Dendrobium catenatum TaxID=906689 RepID=UPI0010A0000E|nr:uncharacterized protein LOC114580691 isoform X2 [Dendrobium catenatum]
MAGRRGWRSSPCFGRGSDGRKAFRTGNYWKVLEGKSFGACEQVFQDVQAVGFDHLATKTSFEEIELLSLDDDQLCREIILQTTKDLKSD